MNTTKTSEAQVPGAGSEVAALRARVQSCVIDGPGTVPTARRRAAFDGGDETPALQPLLETVANRPWRVTDELIAGARADGLSEDAVFELVVAATVGQATRQLASAHLALDAAFADHDVANYPEEP